jgi:hypothetical protein
MLSIRSRNIPSGSHTGVERVVTNPNLPGFQMRIPEEA